MLLAVRLLVGSLDQPQCSCGPGVDSRGAPSRPEQACWLLRLPVIDTTKVGWVAAGVAADTQLRLCSSAKRRPVGAACCRAMVRAAQLPSVGWFRIKLRVGIGERLLCSASPQGFKRARAHSAPRLHGLACSPAGDCTWRGATCLSNFCLQLRRREQAELDPTKRPAARRRSRGVEPDSQQSGGSFRSKGLAGTPQRVGSSMSRPQESFGWTKPKVGLPSAAPRLD